MFHTARCSAVDDAVARHCRALERENHTSSSMQSVMKQLVSKALRPTNEPTKPPAAPLSLLRVDAPLVRLTTLMPPPKAQPVCVTAAA